MNIYSALFVLLSLPAVVVQGKKCTYNKCLKTCPKEKAKEAGLKEVCKERCVTEDDKKACMKECFTEEIKKYFDICKAEDCARPECANVSDCTDVCTICDPPDTKEECKEACMTCKKENSAAYGECFTDCVTTPKEEGCGCDCENECSGLSDCDGQCSEECEGDGATKKTCNGCLKKCKAPCSTCIKGCDEKECIGKCACDFPFKMKMKGGKGGKGGKNKGTKPKN
jgi:hypothetical protein